MRAALLLLLFAGCYAQTLPGMPAEMGEMLGDILQDPGAMDAAMKCGEYVSNNMAGQQACANANEEGWVCSDACKAFWEGWPEECYALMSMFTNEDLDKDFFQKACSGDIPATTPPATNDQPGTPSMPSINVTMTGYSSAFECNTSAGYEWVQLDASLASLSGGGSGAAIVLNSTCADLNTTGCCTQNPAGNLTWAQMGLGKPMVVQGLRVTAPAGQCCTGDDCGPCNERLLNTVIMVGNSSVKAVTESEAFTSYLETLKALAGQGEDTAGMEEAYLWSQLLSNFTSGLCNVVSDFDLYAQGETGGVMINNGTVTIGCGLGMWGGKANTTITGDLAAQLGIPSTVVGIGAGMAVESPQGSWLNLVRFGEDDPLAFCGLEVCAKPADAAATS